WPRATLRSTVAVRAGASIPPRRGWPRYRHRALRAAAASALRLSPCGVSSWRSRRIPVARGRSVRKTVDRREIGFHVDDGRLVQQVDGVQRQQPVGFVQVDEAGDMQAYRIWPRRRAQGENAFRLRCMAWFLDDQIPRREAQPGEHHDMA